jgi:hypothetical protein
MILLCAWCLAEDRPAFLREVGPYRDTRLSHGICAFHAAAWLDKVRATIAAAREGQSAETKAAMKLGRAQREYDAPDRPFTRRGLCPSPQAPSGGQER